VARRKGELTKATIDREWPHQVAVPADVVREQFKVIDRVGRGLSLCARGHTVRREGVEYVVFCFADLAHADSFRERFGGERFNPKERGRGRAWFVWRKR
jgi:hypothetical protein